MTMINPNIPTSNINSLDVNSSGADDTKSNASELNNNTSNTQLASTAKTPAQQSAENHPISTLSSWKNGGNDIAFNIQAAKASGAGLASVGDTGSMLIAKTTPAKTIAQGEDLAPALRKSTVDQLSYESRLQSATSEPVVIKDGKFQPTYSEQLATSAAKIEANPTLLPQGTYKALKNGAFLEGRTGTNVLGQTSNPLPFLKPEFNKPATNALAVAKYSSGQDAAMSKVTDYTNQIAAKQDEIDAIERKMNEPGWGALNTVTMQGSLRSKQIDKEKLVFDRGEFINTARLQSSIGENGRTYQAIGKSADANKVPVIFVPGVNTDKHRGALQALELSNLLGSPVNHVVNTSSKDTMIRAGTGIIAGKVGDEVVKTGIPFGPVIFGKVDPSKADQQIQQHLTGNRPAAVSTANAILRQMNDPSIPKDTPIKLIGYSQGAAIGSQALREVNSILDKQVADQKISPTDKKEMLDRIRFLGIGPGAAERHVRSEFVDGKSRTVKGLETVKYRTVADESDQIARLLGVGMSSPNLLQAKDALTKLAGPNGFHEHLSYFKTYEATDPGSTYNPQAATEIRNWFVGKPDSIRTGDTVIKGK